MSERWEYMSIVMVYSTEEKLEKRTWQQDYRIYRAGEETETRQRWHSDDGQALKTTLLDLLNELGAEGWELTTATVLDSTIFNTGNGFNQVGTPVTTQYLLKRRAGA